MVHRNKMSLYFSLSRQLGSYPSNKFTGCLRFFLEFVKCSSLWWLLLATQTRRTSPSIDLCTYLWILWPVPSKKIHKSGGEGDSMDWGNPRVACNRSVTKWDYNMIPEIDLWNSGNGIRGALFPSAHGCSTKSFALPCLLDMYLSA